MEWDGAQLKETDGISVRRDWDRDPEGMTYSPEPECEPLPQLLVPYRVIIWPVTFKDGDVARPQFCGPTYVEGKWEIRYPAHDAATFSHMRSGPATTWLERDKTLGVPSLKPEDRAEHVRRLGSGQGKIELGETRGLVRRGRLCTRRHLGSNQHGP